MQRVYVKLGKPIHVDKYNDYGEKESRDEKYTDEIRDLTKSAIENGFQELRRLRSDGKQVSRGK